MLTLPEAVRLQLPQIHRPVRPGPGHRHLADPQQVLHHGGLQA